jgi:hypothetical protein
MRPHEGAFTGLMPASCKHAGGVAEPDSAKTADRHYELLPMHARGSRHRPHPRTPAKSSRRAGPKTGAVHVPFGGLKGSGFGPHERGRAALEFYTEVVTVFEDT